ncbi:ABC transporter substrate-binding protein [Janibacter melonis]|uniref:ABC transporter substrate-binding protein n=1 Tax=Janibacter melonis TaxID=262209 RepID=UPI002044A657|nr:ABC transporter substrate-binding protein [Janibacter melonis]MCM3554877.1 ABC transporter substrate-binding protein [Janibacter melonis]
MKRISLRAAVAASTAALVLAGCGAGGRDGDSGGGSGEEAGDTTGITDTTIKIGTHQPLTGVAAPGYSEINTGFKSYLDYVNEAGGIHGRTIEYSVKDDAYNPTNTSKVVDELVLKDEVFAVVGGLGTPTHSAVVDFLNQEKVPDLLVSSGAQLWGNDPKERPMTFGWQPDYEIEGKIMGQYIKEKMPDAKVGLFLQADELGADGEKGLRMYIDDQIVERTEYASGNTDIGPQISKLKESGADLVIGFNTPSYTALSQLAAMKLNYKPKWMYTNVGSDAKLVGDLLSTFSKGKVTDGSSTLDGMMTTEYIPGLDTPDSPWVKLWQKVWDEHGAKGELTNYRIYGMSQAYAFVSALQASGKDLTRERVVEVIEKDGATWPGPGLAPFRWSADSHLGMSGMAVSQVKGEDYENLTEVLVTDIGDAEITPADKAVAEDAPPESGIPDVPETE